ncbi:MAG: ImmA/IrrE family metallo-endopeptidase [Lachnospiraceae bacterium]|nr:ImmA/IrrE family metallo-endopeptidase [Lachnospiraceae bacterium]
MDSGKIFEKLVHLATSKGIIVRFAPLQASDGRIKGNKIAIRQDLPTIEDFNYNLAHELAHAYLHFDKGNTIGSSEHEQYEEQADRAAKMLLEAIQY